jgi:hypothetical protein
MFIQQQVVRFYVPAKDDQRYYIPAHDKILKPHYYIFPPTHNMNIFPYLPGISQYVGLNAT